MRTPEQRARKAEYKKAWDLVNREKALKDKAAWRLANPVDPLKSIYLMARARCTNPNNQDYKYYGGRGITFEFETFEQFIKAVGPRPNGRTLDRIDNSQGYKLGNVKWSTPTEQACNRRPQKTRSGYTGITETKNGFTVRHKSKYIGRTKTLEDAIKLKESYEV